MSTSQLFEYCETTSPKQLVFILHGYGANGESMIELAREFRYALHDAHFVAPNALEEWEGGFPNAYQWFSLAQGFERRSLENMAVSIISSQKKLRQMIDKKLQELNLTYKDLFIAGFSQGAMMAMYQAFTLPEEISGVIAFSGRLILPEMLGDKTLHKPEVCLIHGEEDSVVPFDCFLEAKKILEENNFSCESHAIPHLEHSIDLRAIRAANAFFKKDF